MLDADGAMMAVALFFATIIVIVVTVHRRAMAELEVGKRRKLNPDAEAIEALRDSVEELKAQLHSQMIAVDSLLASQTKSLKAQDDRELHSRSGDGGVGR